MSKNLEKKRIHKKLDDLFSDLDQQIDIPALSIESTPRGWIWEIDTDGVLTACSPEVKNILGYPREDIIGNPISSISDFDLGNKELETAKASSIYPAHIEVIFRSSENKDIDFHAKVFPKLDEQDILLGWRGISISLEKPEEITEIEGPEYEKALVASFETFFDPEDIPLPDTGPLNLSDEVIKDEQELLRKEAQLLEETQDEHPSETALEVSGIEEEEDTILPWDDDEEEEEIKEAPQKEKPEIQTEEKVSHIGTAPLQLKDEDELPVEAIQQTSSKTAPLHLKDLGEELFIEEADDDGDIPSPIDEAVPDIKDKVIEEHKPEPDIEEFEEEDVGEIVSPFDETVPDIKDKVIEEEKIEPELEEFEEEDIGEIVSPFDKIFPDIKDKVIEDQKPEPDIKEFEEEFETPYPHKGPVQIVEEDLPEIKAEEFLDDIEEEDEEKVPSVSLDLDSLPVTPAKTAPLHLTDEDFLDEIYPVKKEPEISSFDEVDLVLGQDKKSKTPLPEVRDPSTVFPDTAPLVIDEETEIRLLEKFSRTENNIIDLLSIIDDDPDRVWNEDDLLLVEQVTSQLTLALENANLFQQTQNALADTDEQARRLRLLNEMSAELSQITDLETIFTFATRMTLRIFNADRVSMSLLSPTKDSLEIVASDGEKGNVGEGTVIPIEGTTNQIAIEENRIIINPNLEDSDLGGIRSFILGPINVGGEILGTLNVGSFLTNAYSENDEAFMAQLLSLLGSIIENRKLFDTIEEALTTTEEQARRLAQLNQISEALSTANTMEEVISITMKDLNKVIPADRCSVAMLNPEKDGFQVYALQGSGEALPIGAVLPVENTLIGEAYKNNKLFSENKLQDINFIDTNALTDDGLRSAIISPLVAGTNVIGTINVGKNEAFAYTIQDENLMQSISSLVGSTIDNRQLLGQIQKRSTQLETSAEVSRTASTILDTIELLPRIVELIKEGFNLYYVGLFIVDDIGQWTDEPGKWAVLRAGTGEAGEQMLEAGHKLEIGGESMIGDSVSNAEARIALDVGEEARFFRNPFLPNTRSEMALPLISRGEVLGALSIQSVEEAAFSQEDITALQTMADQVANAIENARLFEQTETRAEELTVLNEMARAFTQTLDVNRLIEFTYQYIGRLMDASNFYLALFNADDQTYEFKLFIENDKQVPPPASKMTLGEGLTDQIIKNKQPVLIPSNVEENLREMGIEPRGEPAESWLGVPMIRGDQVMGVIAVQNYTTPNTYTGHDLDLLSAASSQASVAIDNARRFQQTQARARYEQILREVTARVHSSTDAEAILKTAVREIGSALGRKATIELGKSKEDDNGASIHIVEPDSPIDPIDIDVNPFDYEDEDFNSDSQESLD